MSQIRNIGIIGRTADGSDLCDGQTIKTRILRDELRAAYPEAGIFVADTYNYKANPLRLVGGIFHCLRTCDAVFILLSRNGMKVIFPLVHALNRLFRRPIFHDCIGGSMDERVKERPALKRDLDRFTVNWVETRGLKDRLDALGVRNVEVLPNFKPLEPVDEASLSLPAEGPFRFCTFSRVTRDKGITAAAQAVLELNREAGGTVAELDIYGPVEAGYEEELNSLLAQGAGAVRYRGVADYQQSVSVLKDYYMLLFPTCFFGEGFPGTLIDAFAAGLPVIATDWHWNGEILTHGETGFLYPVEEPRRLKELMSRAMADPGAILTMRRNCLREGERYCARTVMQTICQRLELEVARGRTT